MAVVALFPEAAFGPALNSVGIGQALRELGHEVVFLSDPGFLEVYTGYGFAAHPVNLSEPLPPDEMARFWADFVDSQIPNFRKSPFDQIDNYVKECWAMIVSPAIKRYARERGRPWVRIISCSENEIEDPAIPPHLSGCGANDRVCFERYRRRFQQVIGPIHDEFNAFLRSCGEDAYPPGLFFEASPHMNLLLYPGPVRFKRSRELPASRFQYLEGCVRREEPYQIPPFEVNREAPLLYVSYGSLGAGDVELLERVIAALGRLP